MKSAKLCFMVLPPVVGLHNLACCSILAHKLTACVLSSTLGVRLVATSGRNGRCDSADVLMAYDVPADCK